MNGWARAALAGLLALSASIVARADEPLKAKVGVLRLQSSAPVFIAQEKGYFREVGLDVELKFFDAAQPIAVATTSGDVDFGITAFTAGLYNLAGNGTLNTAQYGAANQEYQSILAEINNIGATTTYNGQAVFGSAAATPASFSIYTSDGTATGTSTDTLSIATLSSASVGDTGGTISSGAGNAITYTVGTGTALNAANADLTSSANAQTALTTINNAISAVAAQRGYLGSQINTLNSIASVETTQSENLASAENSIMATDYTQATSELSKYQILTQTGISALAQANSTQQAVTKLLQ